MNQWLRRVGSNLKQTSVRCCVRCDLCTAVRKIKEEEEDMQREGAVFFWPSLSSTDELEAGCVCVCVCVNEHAPLPNPLPSSCSVHLCWPVCVEKRMTNAIRISFYTPYAPLPSPPPPLTHSLPGPSDGGISAETSISPHLTALYSLVHD